MTWRIIMNLVLIAALWFFYVRVNKRSHEMGIVEDPFRRPVFVLVTIATFICGLFIILAIFDSITEGF